MNISYSILLDTQRFNTVLLKWKKLTTSKTLIFQKVFLRCTHWSPRIYTHHIARCILWSTSYSNFQVSYRRSTLNSNHQHSYYKYQTSSSNVWNQRVNVITNLQNFQTNNVHRKNQVGNYRFWIWAGRFIFFNTVKQNPYKTYQYLRQPKSAKKV